MKNILPILAALVLAVSQHACRRAPENERTTPTPTPASTTVGITKQPAATPTPELPYRPPPGPPSLAPQATPGSQAPGLNDQEKVEQLFREAN